MFHKNQFRDLVKRSLMEFDQGLYSEDACNLLLGTCAQESLFGHYLKALSGGNAFGIFQIEKSTFEWLKDLYKAKYPEISNWDFKELEWDLRKSIIMARLKYKSCPGKIPSDLRGQAEYYKKYYNTYLGKASIKSYIDNYHLYIK